MMTIIWRRYAQGGTLPFWGGVCETGALRESENQAGDDLIRTVSRHTLSYVLCSISERFRHYEFDPIDLLIIHAVLNGNVLNVMKDPVLDRQFGSVHAVEPDVVKLGVSRGSLVRLLICRWKQSAGAQTA